MSAVRFFAAALGAVIFGSVASLHGAPPPTGVEGLAAFRGDFVKGAVVLAFREPGASPSSSPVARSEATDEDGRYRLLLPPGSYYLLAVKGESVSWPPSWKPGDLYCYYLGNPIPVEKGKMTRVGFNMIRLPDEPPPAQTGKAGIRGRILFEGEPLGRSYVYVYRDPSTNFRGMGVAALPADEKGNFRARLSPGTYYLLARKRKAGGMLGPPGKDDHVGYYFANPVDVRQGETVTVTLETTLRIDLVEEIWFREGESAGWFTGKVLDDDGRPISGIYVLFYGGEETSGTPSFMVGPTDDSGNFRARAAPGKFLLVARSSVGGPPSPGEWYGTWRGEGGEERVEGSSEKEIRIVVTRREEKPERGAP